MKISNLLFLLSLLLCGCTNFVSVDTPRAVASECVRQMESGLCLSRPEESSSSRNEDFILSGVGVVRYSAYREYLDLYDIKRPTDTAMCDLAYKKMITQPGSDYDKIARALWTPKEAPYLQKVSRTIQDFYQNSYR